VLSQPTTSGRGLYGTALDQLLAELGLERRQLLRDSRLTEPELPGGLGERTAAHHSQQGTQVPDLHYISITYAKMLEYRLTFCWPEGTIHP
jgi:hypothetical protein